MALRFSQYNVLLDAATSFVTPYSFSMLFIQISYEQLLPMTIYSASAVDGDMLFFFFFFFC